MGFEYALKRTAETYEFRILIETELGKQYSYVSHYPSGFSSAGEGSPIWQSAMGSKAPQTYLYSTSSFSGIYTKGQHSASLFDVPVMEAFEILQPIQSMVSCSFINEASASARADFSIKEHHYFGGFTALDAELHRGGPRTGSIRFVERPISDGPHAGSNPTIESQESQSLRVYYAFQDEATIIHDYKPDPDDGVWGGVVGGIVPSMSYDWSGNSYNMLFKGLYESTSSYANQYETGSKYGDHRAGDWTAWQVSSSGVALGGNNWMSMSYTGSKNPYRSGNSGIGYLTPLIPTGSWSGSKLTDADLKSLPHHKIHPWGTRDGKGVEYQGALAAHTLHQDGGSRAVQHANDRFDQSIRFQGDFSVQFWAYRKKNADDDFTTDLVFGDNDGSSSFWFKNNADSAYLTLSGSNGAYFRWAEAGQFSTDNWQQYTIVRDYVSSGGGSGTLKLYRNGVDLGAPTLGGGAHPNNSTVTQSLLLGSLGKGAYPRNGNLGAVEGHFHGALGEFKAYNRRLMPNEILNSYKIASGKTPVGLTDKLLRYKFFGKQVSKVLGVPENQWVYTDKFRLSNNPLKKTQIGGTIEADFLSIRKGFQMGSTADIPSDLNFRVTKDDSKMIKWTDYGKLKTGGLPKEELRIGYDNERDSYVIEPGTTVGTNTPGLVISATYFVGNGADLTGVTSTVAPAGSDTHIQFNNDGATGADGKFFFNQTSDELFVGGGILTTYISSSNMTASFFSGSIDSIAQFGHITASQGISASGNISALELGGTLTTVAQPNITSLGDLTTLTVDDITINASKIADAGDLTIDVGGDIILDADDGIITMKDASTGINAFVFKLDATPELDVAGAFTLDGAGEILLDSATSQIRALGHITASGNISASGLIYANDYYLNEKTVITDGTLLGTAGTLMFGDSTTPSPTAILGDTIRLQANVTASGNISASGNITASGLYSSGNITSLGTTLTLQNVTTPSVVIQDTSNNYKLELEMSNTMATMRFDDHTNQNFKFDSNANANHLVLDGGTGFTGVGGLTPAQTLATLHSGGNLKINSHITASGDISSSVDSTLSVGTASFGNRVTIGSNTPAGAELFFSGTDDANIQSQGDLFIRTYGNKTLNLGSDAEESHLVINQSQITASGNISSSGAIYAKQTHFMHHAYIEDSDDGVNFIPMAGSLIEIATTQFYNKMIAPYDGELVKVWVNAENTPGTTILVLYKNGSAVTKQTVAGGDISTDSIVFDDINAVISLGAAADRTFSAGDALQISINPANAIGEVQVTSVWLYTIGPE